MFTISLFFIIVLIINVLSSSLMIEINALRLKLLNIKTKFSLSSSVIKLKINIKILLLNVFELIIMTNMKILILIFIVSIMTSRENLFTLKISNKMRSLNDLIKRFSTLSTLSLKTLILIKNINQTSY